MFQTMTFVMLTLLNQTAPAVAKKITTSTQTNPVSKEDAFHKGNGRASISLFELLRLDTAPTKSAVVLQNTGQVFHPTATTATTMSERTSTLDTAGYSGQCSQLSNGVLPLCSLVKRKTSFSLLRPSDSQGKELDLLDSAQLATNDSSHCQASLLLRDSAATHDCWNSLRSVRPT
jgi:hypothetical protein